MLIRKEILDRIKSGDVTLAFRRWRKPTVKTGGTLRTAIGELAINRIAKTSVRDITSADARNAGYKTKAAMFNEFSGRTGDYYRIELAYAGPDRRIALRDDDALSRSELAEIVTRLSRLDARSTGGPWTTDVLAAIQKHPKLVSTKLASKLGVERTWLKKSIRKLKSLGLTVSHESGYSVSRRGRRVLKSLSSGERLRR